MTADFGDATPEDAWDPDDPVDELVDNLRRRVAIFVTLVRVDDALHQRLRMLGDDLGHIAHRLAD